jgi:hypothetical protein
MSLLFSISIGSFTHNPSISDRHSGSATAYEDSDATEERPRWKHVETETKPEEYVVSTINQVGLPWKITIFKRETIYKWAIFHGYVK